MNKLRLWSVAAVLVVCPSGLLLAGSSVSNTVNLAVSQATSQIDGLELIATCGAPLSIGATSPTPDCGTWEWIAGDGSSPTNIQGVTAQGLLAGALASGQKHSLATSPYVSTSAIDAANAIIERLDADPTLLPYSQSVEFLSSLSEVTGYAPYQAKAEDYYGRVMAAYPTGADVVAHYLPRNSLAGWDVASQIRAALATGNSAYASEIATAISADTQWASVPYNGHLYTQMSFGSMIWALSEFKGSDWTSWQRSRSWNLLASQAADGSWGEDFQTTAYALIGLSLAPTTSGRVSKLYGDLSTAIDNATAFLIDNRDANGTWGHVVTGPSGTTELVYPEVVAECINALSTIKTGGLKLSPSSTGGSNSNLSTLVPITPMR